MTVTAKLRYLRIAPRKVRLVADLIRGRKVSEAQAILSFTRKKAALPLLKLLNSALANARHNFGLDKENLYISKITVDEGPKYKRWMPRARGQVSQIQKKTSHVTLILETPGLKLTEIEKPKKVKEGLPREKIKEKLPPKIPKFKPEMEIPKPKIERGVKKIFRRKAF